MTEIDVFKDLKKESNSEDGQVNMERSALTNNGDAGGGDELPVDNREKTVVGDLPPEIWEKIFLKLESPKDVVNCWKAAVTWAWLVALGSTKFGFKMVFPFVIPYLSKNDLLKCSSLSKSWNVTVDACMQEAEEFGSVSRLTKEQRVVLRLQSWNMANILHTFGLSTNNTSIEETVEVNLVAFRRVVATIIERRIYGRDRHQEDEDAIRGRLSILRFLDHRGPLIRHFHLNLPPNDYETISCLDKVKFLQSCLKRTPNLRVLRISANCRSLYDNEEQLELELQMYFSNNPWPTLKHLKVLKFDPIGYYNHITPMFYAGIANAHSSQLVSLQFGFKLSSFPNTYYCLQKIVYQYDYYNCSGLDFLEDFIQYNRPPVKHLTIILLSPCSKNWNGLTTAVNAACATLETLVIRPFTYSIDSFLSRSNLATFQKLRLPRLKVLQFYTFRFPSASFLQKAFPVLEQLTVALPPEDVGDRNLWHHGRRSDLYSHHQLWKQLVNIESVDLVYPTPRRVTVEIRNGQWMQIPAAADNHKRFTRREYEEKLKTNRGMVFHNQSSSSASKKKLAEVKQNCRKPENKNKDASKVLTNANSSKTPRWRI